MATSNVGQICYRIHTLDYTQDPPAAIIKTTGLNSDEAIAHDQMFGENNQAIIPDNQVWTKMGVQAEPGTRMIVGKSPSQKEIMVGHTGIYEIDNVSIEAIKFIPVQKYVYDKSASEEYIVEGWAEMLQAHADYDEAVRALGPVPTDETELERYRARYAEIANTYATAYSAAYSKYQKGINGIYKPSEEQGDLSDVIIDYIWQLNEEGVTT